MEPDPPATSRPRRARTRPAGRIRPELKVYRVTLTPGPDVLRRGINPLGVLDELRELGETSIVTDPDAVPPLDQIDPERCYLSWTITVKTDASPERLNEAFLFFAEDSTVDDRAADPDGKLAAGPARRAATGRDQRAGGPATGRKASAAVSRRDRGREAGDCPGARLACRRRLHAGQPVAPAAPTLLAAGSSMPRLPPTTARSCRGRTPASGSMPPQLDDLVGLAGELVVVSDNLMGLREIPGVETWIHALEALQRVSRQIRDTTLDLRMVPVDELFSRFPRVVRDLADRSGKEIELRIVGQETRLDRTIVERLSDPMIHLIRNAVDHALEHPSERLEKGKPRVGRITLWAGHEGDRVAIRVEDDGRGLDREKIVQEGDRAGHGSHRARPPTIRGWSA